MRAVASSDSAAPSARASETAEEEHTLASATLPRRIVARQYSTFASDQGDMQLSRSPTAPSVGHQLAVRSGNSRGRRTGRSRAVRVQASVIERIQARIKSGETSCLEVTERYLSEIDYREPEIQSFISIHSDQAKAQAAAMDKKIAEEGWESVGPLAGIPMALKDNICTRGMQTTAGSQILKGYKPPYDATATDKLLKAGAIVIGKTNMDEFGMGSSTENSSYHVTRNPHDITRVPGGSSGGSAAAVSAGLCAAALGSDTGGSIRQPAHFCGVVGLKPTYGRVSRYGLVAYASSLDVIGPIAPTVKDAALVLNVIAGPDPADATTSRHHVEDYSADLLALDDIKSRPLAGKKVALIKETMGEGVDEGVQTCIQAAMLHLKALGAEIKQVSLKKFELGLPAYYVIALSEASSNLSRFDGVRYGLRDPAAQGLKEMYNATRESGLGPEVKRRILMGTYSLSAGYYDAYYKKAQKVRTLVRDEMTSALEDYDLLLCPTAPTAAYKLGEKTTDPLSMYKGDLMTVNLNLSGLPACVIPCGTTQDGDAQLPVGLQMIGRAFGEKELLKVAHIFEKTRF